MEGRSFGRYRLIDLLGRGGMGEVWRAHDTDTDRIVAIKLLPAHFSEGNEDFQRRFRREAHAAARLNSPHVIPIHNYGEIDGQIYVDMRLIEGRDLQAMLADGPLEPPRTVRIIEQVALALQAAHKVGLLHRDVKPSNILLDETDFAYLIDFGISRAADETRLTKSGNTIGTFQYIAPERLGDQTEEDARADIYSLACLLYECLTGRPPFADGTMAGLVAAHLSTPPPQPSTTQPNVPARFDQVIAKGMAKDPNERYDTAVELADAARDAITVPIQRLIPNPAPAPPTEPAPPLTMLDNRTPPSEPTDPALAATQRGPVSYPALGVHGRLSTPPAPTDVDRSLNRPWLWRRPRNSIIAAVIALTAAAIGLTAFHASWPSQHSYGSQVELPFTGLNSPVGVAVDSAGNVYVADIGVSDGAGGVNSRVLKLPAGSNTQVELPFTGLNTPTGVAVDSAGNVYVVDSNIVAHSNSRVLKLPAGSGTQVELPFTRLNSPAGVAVDSAGNVYVADQGNVRVAKLTTGTNAQVRLPFTLNASPWAVAVNSAGDVYVTNSSDNPVLKLPAGSNAQVNLPFTGLNKPGGVAVDSVGNIYVVDTTGNYPVHNNRVLKLPAGSTTAVELPFTGLNNPRWLALDTVGNVYVDDDNNRVLKLPVA